MTRSISICSTLVFAVIVVIANLQICLSVKRGPHHPRSETRKVDQHLTHEDHHMEDDLQKMGISVNLEDMSEEERNFYFFKVHDSDDNNALDGLEMLNAAVHQGDDHFSKVDREAYLADASNELNHIVEVIDEFLSIADSNKDGFLHYPEYMKAVNDNKVSADKETD